MEKEIEPAFVDISAHYGHVLKDLIGRWQIRSRVRILVVVDTEVNTVPGQGFGVGSVIELIRGSRVGCIRFDVDIALRSNETPSIVASPSAYGPKYRGFRFNMQDGGDPVIDGYDQVWCFGFKPSNSGSTSDAEIELPGSMPASNNELAVLANWMNDHKGGLFGTGDHHFLGASMCRRIPRLGTMRRWTNADGVPPIGTPDRIDTLRPPNASYQPGAPGGPLPLENNAHQGDLTVQPINWVSWQTARWPFIQWRRPHPVLCHPTLGPIDVMPDHAHEGLCVPTAEIDHAATFDFGAGANPEYPERVGGGAKPLPAIIAYGSTLGDPPYNFAKGAQPARASFPMISVYDGHLAGVGRVATDSTWHHWMDFNVGNIKAANTLDWDKISRYFINLAVWLTPPGFVYRCIYLDAVLSHFRTVGFQEYQPSLSHRQLGAELRLDLYRFYGPCWVSRFIDDFVFIERELPFEIIWRERPKFDFGGIDPNVLEDEILGRLVSRSFGFARAVKASVDQRVPLAKLEKKYGENAKLAKPEAVLRRCVRRSLKSLVPEMQEHYNRIQKSLEELER